MCLPRFISKAEGSKFFHGRNRGSSLEIHTRKRIKVKKCVVVKAGMQFPLWIIGLRKRLPKPLYADKTTDYVSKKIHGAEKILNEVQYIYLQIFAFCKWPQIRN